MGRFVPQVFLEPGARVGVNDPLVSLGQEKRAARRQLREIKVEKMDECVAVVEDVDLDGFVVTRGRKSRCFSMSRSSACRQRTAGGSSFIGKFEKMMKRAGPKLIARGHQRLPAAR